MIKLKGLLLFAPFLLFSCTEKTEEVTDSSPLKGYPEIDLIHQSQLGNILNNEKDVVIIDVRKKDEFELGHLPNAQNIWRPDIRNNDTTIEGLMAPKSQIEALLSRLGATNESLVIAYDAKGNPDAARLWWILKYFGHKKVALLNGGITAYDSSKITTDIFSPVATSYTFQENKEQDILATKTDVLAAIDNSEIAILDNRSGNEFNAKEKKGNAGIPGRIPSSIFIDYSDNINYSKNLVFHDISHLETIYKDFPKDKNIITYCQSGVRSAETLFVLTQLLGYTNVKNYDGSWLEWSNDSTLPFVQDSILIN